MEKNTNAMEKASCAMEDAAPMGEGISRRSFLGLGALGAAGLAALGLAGCAPQANNAAQAGSADVAAEAPTAEELPAADTEESCDVVVVGLGTSGLVAASAAAKEGAKVIGLDRSASMGATNAAMVSGVWAVESSPELQYDNHLTTKDMFDFIWTSTHYQTNAPLLRNVLPASGKGIDLMIEGGVPFMFAFEGADESTLMLNRGGHIYATSGAERAEALQGMLDKFGVDSRWDAEVTNLLIEDGAVVGVRYESGSIVTDVRASNVIIATGGFIQNEGMLRDYYSGSVMYGTGNQHNDGAGIRLAQSAGAQMGKNFSTSINESGACNMKSADRFVSLSDCNDTPVFSLPLFGGLMVNKHGSRFMDEGTMAKHTMYCGEPLLREGVYYMVIDDGLIDELATTPIMDFISEDAFGNMAPGVQMGFMDKTLTALPEQVQQGIDEGWIWKADSAEALAEACGMENLADTLEAYNGYCATGVDEEMFKEAQFLRAVDTGSLYVVELDIAAWVTLGGIKTDGCCRAVDADANPIPGLFVAGVDGDFWAVPYFEGGSAQGFCVGSGYLAGVTAAQGSESGSSWRQLDCALPEGAICEPAPIAIASPRAGAVCAASALLRAGNRFTSRFGV